MHGSLVSFDIPLLEGQETWQVTRYKVKVFTRGISITDFWLLVCHSVSPFTGYGVLDVYFQYFNFYALPPNRGHYGTKLDKQIWLKFKIYCIHNNQKNKLSRLARKNWHIFFKHYFFLFFKFVVFF